MKQRKLFSELKERLYNYLQTNKEVSIIIMFVILLIGFIFNIYFSYFQEKPKEEVFIEDFNSDALFSSPSNVDDLEILELMSLYEQLKDSTNLSEEKLSKINNRIDELMSKRIDTTSFNN